MITATIHCDYPDCEAWAFCGADGPADWRGCRPVDHDLFRDDDVRGWIDGTIEVPALWQTRAPGRIGAKLLCFCPAHPPKDE